MIRPGFEPVAEVFGSHAGKQRRGGLAFAVTVDGDLVVDLVAGEARPGEPWTSATRAGVASVTKGWSTMVLHLLIQRGLLDLDAPVVDLWPEFAANGKERTTVRHILEHTAGAIGVTDPGSLVRWDGSGWDDLDAIAERVAASTPAWAPGTQCGYHAVTFGWLVGELVRRLDGRTLGTVFQEDLATPLGIASAIGVARHLQGDIAEIYADGPMVDHWLLKPIAKKAPVMMRDPRTLIGQAFLGDGQMSIMDNVDRLTREGGFYAAEVPASNGVSSARDLARLYAVLANGGELDGRRWFTPETVALAFTPGTPRLDTVMTEFATTPILGRIVRRLGAAHRTLGGFDGNGRGAGGPNRRTLGSNGAGGQWVLADPDARLSAAFVRSEFSASSAVQQALVDAVYDCVRRTS